MSDIHTHLMDDFSKVILFYSNISMHRIGLQVIFMLGAFPTGLEAVIRDIGFNSAFLTDNPKKLLRTPAG